MASVSVEYRVLDPTAPKRAADKRTFLIAQSVMSDARSRTPLKTGRLRAGWAVAKVADAEYIVSNPVRYAKYVEFGTRKMQPQPMLGPALIRARTYVS